MKSANKKKAEKQKTSIEMPGTLKVMPSKAEFKSEQALGVVLDQKHREELCVTFGFLLAQREKSGIPRGVIDPLERLLFPHPIVRSCENVNA